MNKEITLLTEQRDLCRRYASEASDPNMAAKFTQIADKYELRAANLRNLQSI